MRQAIAILGFALLSACATPVVQGGDPAGDDPYEGVNRRSHAFNKGLDRAVLRPVSKGYDAVLPEGLKYNISSFSDTVSLPQTIVNQILQGRLGDAGRNTLRFSVNTIIGFGGIADVASDLGLQKDHTDFGATLATWGVGEGAYLELPVLGPATQRDVLGRVVDLFTDPLRYSLSVPHRQAATQVKLASGIGRRAEFSDSVDSVFYESADSYVQLRLIYLQNRRFELGESASQEDELDLDLNTEGF
ncbi:MAG: VacJ family lipoprotein [Pelagimonas sp.]|nr:VacJ family lipoprotein [Pelagimonas sp.]